MRRFLLNIPALMALALLCALATPTVNAQDSPYSWESIDVFIDVQQNGDILVEETSSYAFHVQHDFFRSRYIDMEFIDYIDQVTVSMDGRDLPVEAGRSGRKFKIGWEHRSVDVPETLTFVLRYRARGGMRLSEEQDAVIFESLYGNRGAGGNIDRGTVTVRVPPSVSGQIQRIRAWGSNAHAERPDPRTVKYVLTESLPSEEHLTIGLYFPHGLVDAPTPNWMGASWVFEKTRLISLFPAVNWARATEILYWALRVSPFGLFALLFVSIRIRKSRWPATDYPQGPAGLTMLPSDLPAPAVSVLVNRKVGPQTYLSILVDMLQKGNLAITGTSHKEGNYQSDVKLVRQFEPDQPWEKVVYDDLPVSTTNSKILQSFVYGQQRKAISTHLDEVLQSRGIFDEPPLQVMAEQGQGDLAKIGWFLATAIVALGVGLWVNFWLPWWAGAAVGIPIALVFQIYAWDETSGRLIPTPAGLREISLWSAFGRSIGNRRVSPSLDPSQPDPLLPYAVALNEARQWINEINALPPWFLPDAPGEQTREGLYAAYRGFIGADSWDLDGGPKIKTFSPRSGPGGGGDAGGA